MTEPASPGILLVSELFPPAIGGSAVLFDNIYSRLEGVDVAVLTDLANGGPAEERRERMRVVARRIDGSQRGLASAKAVWQHVRLGATIRRLAGRGRAIVHCGRALPEGLAARFARVLGGPRYVFWAHGEEIASALTSREHTFTMKRVHRRAAAAIANSRHTAGMLEAAGMDRERIHVVYPGVDASRFRPGTGDAELRRKWAPDGETVLLTVGRLQRRKGHDLTIRAVHLLRDELPGLRYVIAGDGEERGRLQSLAAELGVAPRVSFLGKVPDRDLPACYDACDIFVHPNRLDGHDLEGFGIVFLEAAATGKPVIAGRTGGAPEAVADTTTGLLVGGTDAGELAAAVRSLAASKDLRGRLGEAGRRRVLEEFSWERAAAGVRELHRRLVAGPRAS